MTKYKFKAVTVDWRNPGNVVGTVEIMSGDASWPDLAESFYFFLLASGFSLTRQDLSDQFQEIEYNLKDSEEE